MKTKRIYQILFPGFSYENEPWMDCIWLSCGVICLISAAIFLLA